MISITAAEHLSGHILKLRFSDGFERVIDFEPFLTSSRNPQIHEYLQPDKFAGYRLEHGDLVWGDYDLCFSIANLYEGHIS